MAIWSARQVEAQLDPVGNIGNVGAIGLALGFGILFADRAARWNELGSGLRVFVAGVIMLLLCLGVAGAAYAVYLTFVVTAGRSGLVNTMTIFACLCTAGAMVWLVQFRRMGRVRE